uniref:MFS domain-containing protein n=1 Tax=Heligmosomoides polygyrus TaxID=6339 RepID=A0A8L8K178_HELPZ
LHTFRYYISVITVILGGSAQFYSYGIVNPAQRLLTSWINSTYIERYGYPLTLTELNILWSFVVSSIAVGAILGAALTGVTAEKLGRRNGLIVNGMLNVLGAICELFSKWFKLPELLIVGRFIFGVNMGLTSGLVPMYLMEITPMKHRGQAGTLHQVGILWLTIATPLNRKRIKVAVAFSDWFSLLIGLPEVLGNEELWPLAFALPGLPALALCVVLPFCPESPKYTLITLGQRDTSNTGTLRKLFTSAELRVPLVMSILVMIAQQFTGCTAVFAYSTEMFLDAKLSPEIARLSTLGIGIVYFLFACTAPFLIEKVGAMLLSGHSRFFFEFQISWARYGTIAALVMYMCVYGVGSPIPWIITSEMFTQQLVGVPLSYLPFIVVISISITIMYYLLPETRDHSVEDIVSEVRRRTRTVSTGRPWEANRLSSRDELQRLLDTIEQRVYHSTDDLFE